MNKSMLEQHICELERFIKNEAESIEGAAIIYQDNLWDVYKVTSYDAARQLGRGTD